jgi:hypothetical protein
MSPHNSIGLGRDPFHTKGGNGNKIKIGNLILLIIMI